MPSSKSIPLLNTIGKFVLFFFAISEPLFIIVFTPLAFVASFLAWREAQSFPAKPIPSTVAQAIAIHNNRDKAYVVLSDLTLDCQNLVDDPRNGRFIPATNIDQNIFVVINIRDNETCEQNVPTPSGKLLPVEKKRYDYLTQIGLKIDGRTTDQIWELCTDCNPGQALVGMILGLVLGLGGIIYFWFLLPRRLGR